MNLRETVSMLCMGRIMSGGAIPSDQLFKDYLDLAIKIENETRKAEDAGYPKNYAYVEEAKK